MKKIIIIIIIFPFFLFLSYEVFLFYAHDFNLDYMKIDRCLDRGGRWNYETNECEYFDIVYKDWHTSPSDSVKSSNIYPIVKWKDVKKLRIGMNEKKLVSIISSIQNYNHKVNAIIFTQSPDSINYEIAIKLNEYIEVTDLSFKELNF